MWTPVRDLECLECGRFYDGSWSQWINIVFKLSEMESCGEKDSPFENAAIF